MALRSRTARAHRALVAIANHRPGLQRGQYAGGTPRVAAIAERRRQSAPQAAVVQLHRPVGTEALEDELPLLLAKPAEIELVVIAQERRPLRSVGNLRGLAQRFGERPGIL